MSDAGFSMLELFDLAPLERELFLYILRNGPAEVETLATVANREPADIRGALAGLAAQRRVSFAADAVLGRVRGRATLPTQLDPAVPATSQKSLGLRRRRCCKALGGTRYKQSERARKAPP